MATSPNYAWAEPDNSSLVKNGAADIRTLGDAIDTSVWNVGYGQAGKNKIINGDFNINQRGFTSNTTAGAYNFDRCQQQNSGGTTTVTPQTFTTGAAPVAGYESKNFVRIVTASQSAVGDYGALRQNIESVRTFAGQTVTFSVYAKASTGTPKIGVAVDQNFGSGGSPSAQVTTSGGTATISTSWARYSFTIAVPSIAGKTIGTASDYLAAWLFTSAGTSLSASGYPAVGIQNVTIDTWGWQIEYGSKATPFQTASGGSPQAELAMCQRYYAKSYAQGTAPATNGTANGLVFASTTATAASTNYLVTVKLPVVMRTSPTLTIYSFTTSQTGRVSDGAGTDLAAGSGSTNLIADSQFTVQNSSGGLITAAQGGFVFHYVANGEL
jgi:hypothetical protein